jgi:hypothetical protein
MSQRGICTLSAKRGSTAKQCEIADIVWLKIFLLIGGSENVSR